MFKTFINWVTGKKPPEGRVDLLWMDLTETKKPEIFFLEGYDQFRDYYSTEVYLKEVYNKGLYQYEVWKSTEINVTFHCDCANISVFRNEEVIRAI